MLAQSFFALTLLFSVFTSKKWLETEESGLIPTDSFNLRTLSLLAVAVIYMQLFLGGAFRHNGMHFLPHIIGAAFATVVLLWTAIKALTSYGSVPQIKKPAIGILSLLFVQLALGFGAYLTRVEWGRDAVQPAMSMVITTVAHVTVGAVLLGKAFVLAVQAHRHIRATSAAALRHEDKVATA